MVMFIKLHMARRTIQRPYSRTSKKDAYLWASSQRFNARNQSSKLLCCICLVCLDWFKNTAQAGKLIPRGHGAKECLIVTHASGGQPRTPERVKKFRSLTHPEPGQARVFRSPTEDPNIDEDICHGVKTKSSLEVQCITCSSYTSSLSRFSQKFSGLLIGIHALYYHWVGTLHRLLYSHPQSGLKWDQVVEVKFWTWSSGQAGKWPTRHLKAMVNAA